LPEKEFFNKGSEKKPITEPQFTRNAIRQRSAKEGKVPKVKLSQSMKITLGNGEERAGKEGKAVKTFASGKGFRTQATLTIY